MSSRDELREILKTQYGINKGITETLNEAECQSLLESLGQSSYLKKIVKSFADKTADLGKNNRVLGQQRSRIESKYVEIERECKNLQEKTEILRQRKEELENLKNGLSKDTYEIELEIQQLTDQKRKLESRLQLEQKEKQEIKQKNDQLNNVNANLKKENRDLKNINDALKLKFAQEIAKLTNLENSEIRRGLLKLVNLIGG